MANISATSNTLLQPVASTSEVIDARPHKTSFTATTTVGAVASGVSIPTLAGRLSAAAEHTSEQLSTISHDKSGTFTINERRADITNNNLFPAKFDLFDMLGVKLKDWNSHIGS